MPDAARTLALFAALLLLGTAALPGTALAQDDEADDEAEDDHEDEQERDDEGEREDDEKRSVEIEREGSDFEISLERETGENEDEVEMKWNAEEAAFELEYKAENETRELEHELKAVFGAIAEYEDANDNDRYDDGEALASYWSLGDEADEDDDREPSVEADWQPVSVEDVTVDGKDGKELTATASLEDEGNVTLRFLVFGDFVEVNGTSLAPTGAKIDIVIEDYPFEENGTDLALFLETETKSEFELEDEADEDETGVAAESQVNGTEIRLAFTWLDTAQVDGSTEDVATTTLEEEQETETEDGEAETEQERKFVLSYPRGDEVVHDPKAEVQIQAAQSTVPAPGVLGAIVAVATLATVLGRRRVQR